MSSETPQRNLGSSSPAPPATSFGPFCLDVANVRLLRGGVPVALTPKAFEALVLLVVSPGRLVTREQFIAALWPDTIVEDGNLTSTIWMVRRALGEHEDWVQTVPKRGYRFVGDVVTQPPALPSPPTAVPAGVSPAPPRWRAAAAIAVGVLTVLATAGAVFAPWPAGWSMAPVRAVAVLPFRTPSADADQAYFADGMTDAVITDLASISALRVAPHQSVRRYADSDTSPGEIARELGVDAIVQGSVARTGSRIRLTVQLVDARSNRHLWAQAYDREMDDVLTLQGELARAVADAVQARISTPERSALGDRPAVTPEAYDDYLRGRYFFAQRSEPALVKSRDSFRRAIDRDPTFAPAWAGLALAYGPSAFFGYVTPAEGASGQREAAERALQLDPMLVDAQVALANGLTLFDHDWQGSERAYRRILERHPDNAQARLWYGMSLGHQGRFEEALAERTRALSLDPLSLRFNTSVADTLTAMHRYDEAIARYRTTLELEPGFASAHLGLGMALFGSGRMAEAVQAIEEGDRRSGDMRSRAMLGHAYGRVGRVTEAQAILGELRARAMDRYLSPVYLAFVHAGLGDLDAAFSAVDDALDDGSPLINSLNSEPLFDALRGDPRLAGVLRRLALPAPAPARQ